MSQVSDTIMSKASTEMSNKGVRSSWQRIEVGYLGHFTGIANKRRANASCAIYDEGDEEFINSKANDIITSIETQIRMGGIQDE